MSRRNVTIGRKLRKKKKFGKSCKKKKKISTPPGEIMADERLIINIIMQIVTQIKIRIKVLAITNSKYT